MSTPEKEDCTSVFTSKGRVFQFSHSKPYLTKDGRTVPLHVWLGECRTCGEPFEVITTQRNPDPTTHNVFDLVNCKQHRMSFRTVCALGRETQKAKRDAAKALTPPDPHPGVRIGSVQESILAALTLAGDLPYGELVDSCVKALAPPPEGKRDRRREIVQQSISIMLDRGVASFNAGVISLLLQEKS